MKNSLPLKLALTCVLNKKNQVCLIGVVQFQKADAMQDMEVPDGKL